MGRKKPKRQHTLPPTNPGAGATTAIGSRSSSLNTGGAVDISSPGGSPAVAAAAVAERFRLCVGFSVPDIDVLRLLCVEARRVTTGQKDHLLVVKYLWPIDWLLELEVWTAWMCESQCFFPISYGPAPSCG
jgi:hypothetical protein